MALYRLEMQNFSRSDGVSSVAKAAYRHRCEMVDERTGEVHGKKSANRGDLIYAKILRPEDTPACLHVSSEELWNIVEKTEKRKDARTAKEFKITLPRELSNEQNAKLLEEYLTKSFVSKGIICDFVIHNDKDNKNPHAHVMITTREITPDGFGKKVREWDTEESLNNWRKDWAKIQNIHLKNNGFKSRVSHRTLSAQKKIMIELAKKAEEEKDLEKSILYLAKAVELDRPPMKNLPRSVWKSERGQEQRKSDQQIRDKAKQDAILIKSLRSIATVSVDSFIVHPLQKKELSKNNDFGFMKSWWQKLNNFVGKVKIRFSSKTDNKNTQKEPEIMIDPVSGLMITKQKWQEMSDRASVKTPQPSVSYQARQSDRKTSKAPQNALQSDLEGDSGKKVRVQSAPLPKPPGTRRRKVKVEEDDQV
jgi:hypothetical protein